MIGTDFTMIQRLFSHRNRDEIKRKFKREEKLNQALIDKILCKYNNLIIIIIIIQNKIMIILQINQTKNQMK